MSKFGLRLLQLRKASKLTQDELSKKIGVSRSAVGMYEKGEREPDFDTLERFADFFNVDTDYLTGRSDKTTMIPESGYYTNPETAASAQEMFDDPDMQFLYDMKRNMDPARFKVHMDYMKELYRQENPENDDTGC